MKGASAAARALARKRDSGLAAGAGGDQRGTDSRAARAERGAGGGIRGDPRGHPGGRVPDISAARRNRVGEDGSLPERDRGGAGAGARRAAAGAGDRADAGGGGAVLRALRRPGGHSAQRVHGRGTVGAVAAHPVGGGVGGGGDALGGVRAGAEAGADRGGRGARRQLQAGGDAAVQRAGRGHRARAGGGGVRGSGVGHAEPGEPVQRGARQVHAARTAGADRGAAHAEGGADRHAAGVSGDAQAGDVFAQAGRGDRRAAGERRADHRAAEPARIFELRGVPGVRRAHPVHELLADADVSQARPAAAVPLLRVCGEGAAGVPEVRERAYLLSGAGIGAGGGGAAPGVPDGADRAAGPRHGDGQAALRDDSAGVPRGQLRHSGRARR